MVCHGNTPWLTSHRFGGGFPSHLANGYQFATWKTSQQGGGQLEDGSYS